MRDQLNARRARILHTARNMIAEQGYNGVTVRELAVSCGVSVPTLYNQFGSKDQLLAAAIEDYFHVGQEPILAQTAPGLARITTLISHNATSLLADPEFHRSLLGAFASLDTTYRIQQSIAERFTGILREQLSLMREKRQLKDWVSTASVATQLTSTCIATSIQWGAGVLSDDVLEASMHYATGLILLGICRGTSRGAVEALVNQAQSSLAVSSAVESSGLHTPNGDKNYGSAIS